MTFRDFVLLSTCILLRLLLRWPAIFKAQPQNTREDLISRSLIWDLTLLKSILWKPSLRGMYFLDPPGALGIERIFRAWSGRHWGLDSGFSV